MNEAKRKLLIYILAALVFGAVLCFFANQIGYKAGWLAAKQRLVETGFLMPENKTVIGDDYIAVSGFIKELREGEFVLAVDLIEPLTDPELDNRIIKIADNTKVILRESKNQQDFLKEMEAFEKDLEEKANSEEGITDFPPMPKSFIPKDGKLSDIKEGRRVIVSASENIRYQKEFVATEIAIEMEPQIVF